MTDRPRALPLALSLEGMSQSLIHDAPASRADLIGRHDDNQKMLSGTPGQESDPTVGLAEPPRRDMHSLLQRMHPMRRSAVRPPASATASMGDGRITTNQGYVCEVDPTLCQAIAELMRDQFPPNSAREADDE